MLTKLGLACGITTASSVRNAIAAWPARTSVASRAASAQAMRRGAGVGAARNGGGAFYNTENETQLEAALEDAIRQIVAATFAFATPVVPTTSTTGSSKACNAQPVVLNTRLGAFAFAHNGNLVNAAELRHAIAADMPEVEFTSTTDSELIAFAIQHAVNVDSKENSRELAKSRKLARGYLNEIASDYSYATVRFFDRFLTWLWTQLYDGVEVAHFERVRELASDHEIIYVPCHRSHMDYLLLSYVIYKRGLRVPYVAAGENLAVRKQAGCHHFRRQGDRTGERVHRS